MQPTPAIKDWVAAATSQLTAINIPTANLDAEIILAHVLNKDRTYIHAHPEQILDHHTQHRADEKLKLRLGRVPIAYITGHKEFHGHNFLVTPFTLIPRPESENIIEALKHTLIGKKLTSTDPLELVDVGTGSGCLGITAKLEFPELNVTLLDISNEALNIAKANAESLSADVRITRSDLLQNYLHKPDIIIANLPYVDRSWERSPETNHEPSIALFADDGGKIIIKTLILQASNFLSLGGYLIIECDPTQHESLIEFAKNQSFNLIETLDYILVFRFQY